jgi:hypothetical protein
MGCKGITIYREEVRDAGTGKQFIQKPQEEEQLSQNIQLIIK